MKQYQKPGVECVIALLTIPSTKSPQEISDELLTVYTRSKPKGKQPMPISKNKPAKEEDTDIIDLLCQMNDAVCHEAADEIEDLRTACVHMAKELATHNHCPPGIHMYSTGCMEKNKKKSNCRKCWMQWAKRWIPKTSA